MIFNFFRKKSDEPKPADATEDEQQVTTPEQKPEQEQHAGTAGAPGKASDERPDEPPADTPEPESAESGAAPQPAEPAPQPEAAAASAGGPEQEPEQAAGKAPEQGGGFFARIKRGLARSSNQFAEGLGNLFLGAKEIDEDLLEELETQLILADVGIEATSEIIDNLTDRVSRRELADSDALYAALQQELRDLLVDVEAPLEIDRSRQPFVILVVGVNGVGKTTTIGKLARRLMGEGKSVMLAAGDTFRAAAVEQLQVWGERNQVPVVAQHTGADSASVIYDAVQSAQARNIDVVIADTAGRLHNKAHLMEELAKVRRVMGKLDNTAPHEVLLVLDAGTGQNALSQASQFRDSAGVTGIALTKLDGTAKGGVVFALAQKFGIPVRFIGVGEQAEDLQPFEADAFVKALFQRN
ncbi:signal recognition particle-docking protein FtsY [Biformimicrobium ophioploci]|uniref:Signal recognition particle receptor FtsY n=1 Tax=Biformimicrobium ophioploci TaxID=3036711 RepID=A0ABQ6LVT1_9GAMM|nr:signal recognition particle-docking protein FtsY [Microbulbifer sp. NKW57]GMG86180.1 hypothetical protein MNKW57_05010 [Microbulbifer sp. NKW57]